MSKNKKEEQTRTVGEVFDKKLRPAEWASQKGISNVLVAGAFCDDNNLMSEEEFDKKLEQFMKKPASY